MIYLTGSSNKNLKLRARELGIGLMTQPGSGYKLDLPYFDWWAADNGCFSQGTMFDPEKWLVWLDGWPREGCLFAVAPDVLCDATATLERSRPHLDKIREMGFPAALVAQNGIGGTEVPWDSFDALFIGGDDYFKLDALECKQVVMEAKARGKWVHMGRVNSESRLCKAVGRGCDSVDGTFIAFGPDVNLERLEGWLKRLSRPLTLFEYYKEGN